MKCLKGDMGNEMENRLEDEIKEMLVDRLSLDDEDIRFLQYDTPLFGDVDNGGLGLDSVDSLEIVVGLKDVFGVDFDEKDKENVKFTDINAIADFIRNKH